MGSSGASRGGVVSESDPTAVHLTGAETVAGVKTFSSEPVAPSFKATGTTGAPNQGRFVGVTVTGAPSSGTYAVGDFVLTQNGQLFVCVTAGTPGTWTNPRDLAGASLLNSGEEMYPRYLRNDSVTLTNQRLQLMYFTARKSETTTQVRVLSGTTATSSPTLVRLGLYSVDSAGAGTLVASTANDTTLLGATNTVYTKSWSSSYAKVAGQRYALAVLSVASTAGTMNGVVTSGYSTEFAVAPRMAGYLAGQADLPASFTDAGLTGTPTFLFYAAVLP